MPKIPKRRRSGQHARLPKTLAQYDQLPKRSQTTLENVAHAITRMRDGLSLKHAAAEFGVAPRTVVKRGGSALRKNASGRYTVRASDTLLRVLEIPVRGGKVEVAVKGSRAASAVAERLNAQRYFAETGDASKMRALASSTVLDASGRQIPFLTDLDELERLGNLGELSFESIYARRG